MSPLARLLVLLAALGCGAAAAQVPEKVRDFETRPGVTVRTLELVPPGAQGAILLYPGGDGALLLNDSGSARRNEDNFMVRTRQRFAAAGLRTYLVDVPSDRRSAPYMYGHRATGNWVEDVRKLAAAIHAEAGVPVWVAGFSASSGPIAGWGNLLGYSDAFAGGVLISTCPAIPGVDASRWPLASFTKPVLVVHHRRDPCDYCPPAAIEPLFERVGARRKHLLWFDGGQPAGDVCGPRGCDLCGPRSEHGFNGIEDEVVRAITDWIKAGR